MADEEENLPTTLDEARTQLRDGLDNARKLVERARAMLSGESDESPA
ncbi:MAG: hypothetical protein ACO1OD_13545 [Croceibacterium sp.]